MLMYCSFFVRSTANLCAHNCICTYTLVLLTQSFTFPSCLRFEEDIFSPVQSFPSSVEQETQPPSYPSVPGASPGGSVQGKNSPSHPTPPVGPLGGSVLRKNPPSFPRPTAAIAEGVGLPSETEMVQRIHNHVGLDRFTERKMTLGQKDIETVSVCVCVCVCVYACVCACVCVDRTSCTYENTHTALCVLCTYV